MVEFPLDRDATDGPTGTGYLAASAEGAGLGVVVIQEWWGVDDHIMDVCERFAAEGCTALAPDLYHGTTVPHGEPDEASRAAMGLELDRAGGELSGAVDFLLDHPSVRGHSVGVVGFCIGGGLALWLATLRPDRVAAVVPFYGLIPWSAAQPDYSRMTAAVEGHYAEDDDLAGPPAVRKLEDTLTELGKEVRMFLYPATHHAFFNDTRPEVYDEEAARVAWVRTLEFLRSKLG
ncbi:MAG: carboxymethylenebutenolidase [Actinomycetota bacterium]|jgi:carboxymethylenebutenolidase|nr:carboxymethylenebutenolidase [Actinomycetota bacterium]